MFDTVRVRLTLWYSMVLGLVLVLLAVLTYFLYWRSISQRTDNNIMELSEAFIATFDAELADEQGPEGLRNAGGEAMLEHGFGSTDFVLLDPSENIIQSSLELTRPGNPKEPLISDVFSSEAFRSLAASASAAGDLHTIHGGTDGFRGLARPLSALGRVYTLVVLQSLHPQAEIMEDIRNTFLWAIPIALLLASIGGYFLAWKSLAPVGEMASQARGMGASNLRELVMPFHL